MQPNSLFPRGYTAEWTVTQPQRGKTLLFFTPLNSYRHMKQFLLLVLTAVLSLSAGAQTRTFTDQLVIELGGKSGATAPSMPKCS